MVLKNDPNRHLRFIPREPGIFTPEQVQILSDIMSREGAGPLRLILDLPLAVTVNPNMADEVRQQLVSAGLLLVPDGPCVKDVKICPFCDHGTGSYRELGRKLNEDLMGMETPAPVRISVSGCGCRCAMSMLQDIGLVSGPQGFTVYIGGNPYGKPIIGVKVAEGLATEKVLPAIEAILELYDAHRDKVKYLHQLVKKVGGSEPFEQAITKVTSEDQSCASTKAPLEAS